MDRESKISVTALSEVETALKQYVEEVLDSSLSLVSQEIYVDHASNFVRWLRNEFSPGSRVAPFPKVLRRPRGRK